MKAAPAYAPIEVPMLRAARIEADRRLSDTAASVTIRF